ncbi:MAG: hypothetical protein ACR2PI_03735 [Hyphomicrobiaceae bacterium]
MNDRADPVDATIGSYRVLHADPGKWRLVAAIGGGFVAIGIAMIIANGDFLAWFTTLFFALVAGVGLFQLYGSGSYLELDADTFVVTNLGRAKTERWDECANFHAYRISRVEQVAFDRARDVDTHLGEMNRAISGRSAGLPDTFGMDAGHLAELMNAYRQHGVERSWQRHAEAVEEFRERIADGLDKAGQPADILTDADAMSLPQYMQPWPSILAVLKEPRLDGSPHVLICADILSPRSRWIPEETKRSEAFDLLGATELQIIDPESKSVRRIMREAI